jgi:hypothetical protein
MGMIDYYRLPKNQWYWYRANKAKWSGTTNLADPTPSPANNPPAEPRPP